MTEKEFLADFDQFIHTQFEIYRKTLPYLTGNLSLNAYKLERTPNGYKIYIDLSIAPYAEYINQPGRVHEGFFEKLVVNQLMKDIQTKYGNYITGG